MWKEILKDDKDEYREATHFIESIAKLNHTFAKLLKEYGDKNLDKLQTNEWPTMRNYTEESMKIIKTLHDLNLLTISTLVDEAGEGFGETEGGE
jgi:hypothetical protein